MQPLVLPRSPPDVLQSADIHHIWMHHLQYTAAAELSHGHEEIVSQYFVPPDLGAP
jgi:hypothetical protein